MFVVNSQSGNAVVTLLIVVVLFGLLTMAFLHGSRSNLSMLSYESDRSRATKTQDCENNVQLAVKRLVSKGCNSGLISYEADGSNGISGAPTNGSCSVFHSNGGALAACGNYDPTCMLVLAPGQSCAGVIYIGEFNGERLYTRPYDQGTTSWANGTGPYTNAGAYDLSDGVANTNMLDPLVDTGAPYRAVELCRAMGPEWFLPARHTMTWLYTNKNLGDLAGTIQNVGYWSSSERDINRADLVDMLGGGQGGFNKGNVERVRCMRKDP